MMKIFKFYGGVHPEEAKVSSAVPIADAPLYPLYTVPLSMHIGAPARALVKAGDVVLRGQRIGEAASFVSANIHSPTSGKVKSVGMCLGPAGTQLPCVVIESDGEDKEAHEDDEDELYGGGGADGATDAVALGIANGAE